MHLLLFYYFICSSSFSRMFKIQFWEEDCDIFFMTKILTVTSSSLLEVFQFTHSYCFLSRLHRVTEFNTVSLMKLIFISKLIFTLLAAEQNKLNKVLSKRKLLILNEYQKSLDISLSQARHSV